MLNLIDVSADMSKKVFAALQKVLRRGIRRDAAFQKTSLSASRTPAVHEQLCMHRAARTEAGPASRQEARRTLEKVLGWGIRCDSACREKISASRFPILCLMKATRMTLEGVLGRGIRRDAAF